MTIWQMVLDNITRNAGKYATAAGLLFVAIVSTAPPKIPQSLQDVWTWGREALQTAIPAARHPVLPQEPNHEDKP